MVNSLKTGAVSKVVALLGGVIVFLVLVTTLTLVFTKASLLKPSAPPETQAVSQTVARAVEKSKLPPVTVALSATRAINSQSPQTFDVSLKTTEEKLNGFQIYLDASYTGSVPPSVTVSPASGNFTYLIKSATADQSAKSVKIALAAYSLDGFSATNSISVGSFSVSGGTLSNFAIDTTHTKIISARSGDVLPLSSSSLEISQN